MYEHHKQPLAKQSVFAKRLALNGIAGLILLIFSLGIGMFGYHFLEGLSWIDSLLNASMILGGMGPVAPLADSGWKIIRLFLCFVFRGGFVGGSGYSGDAYFPPLPASFPSCRR